MTDKKRLLAKSAVKAVSEGSIAFLIGGITMAVMPAGTGVPIMVARIIGSVTLAGYITNGMDGYIEDSMNEMFSVIDDTKEKIETIKKMDNNTILEKVKKEAEG